MKATHMQSFLESVTLPCVSVQPQPSPDSRTYPHHSTVQELLKADIQTLLDSSKALSSYKDGNIDKYKKKAVLEELRKELE